jgi:APA family basic amino acid/polyamine antiporter
MRALSRQALDRETLMADGEQRLARALGLREAAAIIIGGIIGSGIFMTPSMVSREVGTPTLTLLVWVVASGLAFCGALSFAELGASIPRTGGTYQFLRVAYATPLVAFLCGWAFFFVDGTGAIASLATTFATYSGFFLSRFAPMTGTMLRIVAVLTIAVIAAINYVGVRAGGRAQVIFTTLKVAALIAIIVAGLTSTGGWDHFRTLPAARPQGALGPRFATAMIGALFSYAGWSYTSYVAGEIENPRRNLPLSIILGMVIVLAIYLAVNVAYMKVLPFADLQQSALVASDAMQRVIGPRSAGLIAAAVMVSTIGALNAVTLAYARIAYAMANDGLFFRRLSTVHPRYQTPANAIIVQGLVAAAFALSGSFEQIIDYFAFIDYFFFGLAVASVIILRRRFPQMPRPFKMWGYPVTPVLFLGTTAWYLSQVLIHRFRETMVGIGILLLGIPFYWYWRRAQATTEPSVGTADVGG